jgi:enoyl-CoA hydratase
MVKNGESLSESIKLAKLISSFPQLCLRNDRLSMLEGEHLNLNEALKLEFQYGKNSLLDAPQFVSNFQRGEGRGGSWNPKL